MTGFLASFEIYYLVVCSAIGGVVSAITVSEKRMRAARLGALIGAVIYVIQLPIWLTFFNDWSAQTAPQM